jgi:hypothetical protein
LIEMVHTKFLFSNAIANGSTTRQAETHVFNMAKLMSSVNRKGYHNVDNQGHAQMYTIGIKLFGTKADALITAAPNAYYVRRAIKAWHDARVSMYKRAGISIKSLGYGRALRPYLDVNHENGTTVEIDTEATGGSDSLLITPTASGDEWTYSRAAVTTPHENTQGGNPEVRDLVDTYSFTILGDSVTESTTEDDPDESSTGSDQDSYVSVGMVAEWLGSFKKKSITQASEALDPDNALLQLRSQQSADKEEVLELAKDAQNEGRPWDADDAQFKTAVFQGFVTANSAESPYMVFQAPCGLFNLTLGNSAAAETIYTELEVLDISDM